MKQLRSLLLVLLTVMSIAGAAADESLRYRVVYRWGLVNKTAGHASFHLTDFPTGRSTAVMFGRTEPWADHFFKVRDTLITTFDTPTRLPYSYTRIAHEGGRYAKDIVKFSHRGELTEASCTRLRRGKKDKETTTSTGTLQAVGDAVDLLSSFYYLRSIDFNSMNVGRTKVINIFSGKKKERLTFTYNGIEEIKIDGKKYRTHYVTFTFTSDQGKTTSQPIKAWLEMNPAQTPLKLEGELKIGKVQCFLER